MNKQTTKSQHYIPQFYLKKWVDFKGGFYPIKIIEKHPPKLDIFKVASSPNRFCSENYFYAQCTGKKDKMSQFFENIFKDIEGDLSLQLPKIEKRIIDNQQISFSDKYLLSQFMVFIWLRGKLYRQQSIKMTEDVIKKLNKSLVHYIDEDEFIRKKMDDFKITKDDMIQFVEKGDYAVEMDNIYHLNMLSEINGFSNILSAKYWLILISRRGHFITSDAPYLDMPINESFWGNDFLSREQSFVLSPNIFIIALYPKNDCCKKIKRKDVTNDINYIQQINCHNLMNSIQFGFHKDKELLEDLYKRIEDYYSVHLNEKILKMFDIKQ